ncbi:MAG: VIT1/CCC1 transporter family protein [Clostridia bacterium]
MNNAQISTQSMDTIIRMQRNEITEQAIYTKIAARVKDEHNRSILLRIAAEERAHYEVWKLYTHREIKPQQLKVIWHSLLSVVLGFTFAIKLMENGERIAQNVYSQLILEVPQASEITAQEDAHEQELMELLDEERLKYVGSMVLGLSDALVELTGTLAGLTLAMQNTRLIALSGLITGISATLSMASSEFLSARSEGRADAFKSCLYTGIAYIITVALMVLPYLLFADANYMWALGTMIVIVVAIIAVFNYYLSVAKSKPFRRSFLEMVGISLGVAVIAFGIGLLVKQFLGIDI